MAGDRKGPKAASRGRGRKGKGGARKNYVAKIPRKRSLNPNEFAVNFKRTYELKTFPGDPATGSSGQLNFCIAIGNVKLCGSDRFVDGHNLNASTTNAEAGTFFPQQLLNMANIFTSAKVLKHSVQLIPICGADSMSSVPLLTSYSRFGTYLGMPSSSAPNVLTSYISNSAGAKMHTPGHEIMPSVTRTFYPLKSSISDNSEFILPTAYGSGVDKSSGCLDVSTGAANSAKTLGFYKGYAESCGSKDASGHWAATPVYQSNRRDSASMHEPSSTLKIKLQMCTFIQHKPYADSRLFFCMIVKYKKDK
jgi:hypothetical protein